MFDDENVVKEELEEVNNDACLFLDHRIQGFQALDDDIESKLFEAYSNAVVDLTDYAMETENEVSRLQNLVRSAGTWNSNGR